MEIILRIFNEATGQKTFYRAAYLYLSPPSRCSCLFFLQRLAPALFKTAAAADSGYRLGNAGVHIDRSRRRRLVIHRTLRIDAVMLRRLDGVDVRSEEQKLPAVLSFLFKK